MSLDYIVKVSVDGAEKIDKATESTDGLATSTAKATAAFQSLGADAAAGMSVAAASLDKAKSKFDEQMAGIDKLLAQGRIGQDVYGMWAKAFEKTFKSSLVGDVKTLSDALERINAPVQRYGQDLTALSISLDKGQISLEQYEAALAKVQKQAERGGALTPVQGPAFDPNRAGVALGPSLGPAFDQSKAGQGLSEELRREQAILENLNGPLREYQAQVAALDRLLQKGAIDGADYNRELEKAQKASSKGLSPVQGPKPPGDEVDSSGAGNGGIMGGLRQALKQLPGGQALSQLMTGGTAAIAGVAALALEFRHLSDEYTTLTNKVERFTSSGMSADEMLHQQYDLSKQLHSSLAATEEIYVKLRESTTDLNLSQRQTVELERDIGSVVAAEGKSAEAAAALTQRLALAFETGAISGRELRSIMRQYPEVADGFSHALGVSRAELIQLANKGGISARQIIEAFKRMEPEAAATIARLSETSTQRWQHIKDGAVLAAGAVKNWVTSNDVDDVISKAEAKQRQQVALARQLTIELERNARTASIAGAAKGIGIDVGPFSQSAADSLSRAQIAARAAGIDLADAFANAKDKAQLYGAKIDEIREQHAAKEIADDAKRIYEALYGADDILKGQFKKWVDISDQVATITKAIERWRVLDAGAPPSRERTELERQKRDLTTEQDLKPLGEDVTKYAQGIDKARDGLQDWTAAAKAGRISQEELRKKTDEFLTTLNDGRLPEAIRIWEGIHLPIDQAARDMAALGGLVRRGALDIEDYVVELRKIAETHKNGNAAILTESIDVLDQRLAHSQLTLHTYDEAVVKLAKDFEALHRTTSGMRIEYRIAPVAALEKFRDRGVPGEDVSSALAQARSDTLIPESVENFKQLNAELERSRDLALEFVAPAVKYEQALKAIDIAQKTYGNTDDQASFQRRRARVEYENAEEALARLKGPLEAYEATLRHLDAQLARNELSQSKYSDAVRKAKEQLLTDTGGDKTFLGGLELQFGKLQGDAERLGATVANQLVGDVDKFNDAIVSAANGGQVSWSGMADAMIQDLERVILKTLELKLISAGISLFSGGGGAAADSGASNFANVGDVIGDLGYANGGSFIVGGQGGIDSKFLGMRVTPGEMVTVQTPGQQSGSGRAQQQAPQVIVQPQIHNHYDTSIGVNAIASPAGQQAIFNVMKANAAAIRRALGGGL